ncbi:CAMK/CAMKL/CHK1 protein kinase [Salpingoeca rosetta]|uniref:non-specific serine/threonine protein kinase n=1 Tax=Salpingoeca rosetta (strain ATCC 50818 / BSB-021) TaxID=946362 RepID=F2TWJ6_SALR5|nr:CAMK/CAMKL/CHK1 protein kinase [Salpingoeca rosetta]EGD72442.1 CAMK/CAMKL/CHK1 protein kinase [Salpingoeca rosetta]|eukprot:XP_004999011.1 CAMK/CAMKL/CHK1 protein kinase [Salpingoeca rosetta]
MSFRGHAVSSPDGGHFLLTETLGEGGFGKVKLAEHQHTQQRIAVKIFDLERVALINVRKEMVVHRNVKHPNVVGFLGFEIIQNHCFVKLELCQGGELFDKIVPDDGMPRDQAHFYFRQLLSAVRHLQNSGIVHRDLKPENILVDAFGNVKIADFGFATLFRNRGKERPLRLKCGTPPYVAPEVLTEYYEGTTVDLWSLGVILVAMLAGCLPWSEPTKNCPQYLKWSSGLPSSEPWPTIKRKDRHAYDLLLVMLHPDVKARVYDDRLENSPYAKRTTPFTEAVGATMMLTPKHAPLLGADQGPRLEMTAFGDPDMDDTQRSQQPTKRPKMQQGEAAPTNATATTTATAGVSVGGADEEQDEAGRSCRTNSQRKLWFESSLRFRDILERFEMAIEDYAKISKSELSFRRSPHKANVLLVTTPDPHVGLESKGDVIFSIRATERQGRTTIVDFMLIKGSGMHFRKVVANLRSYARDVMSTCNKPSQVPPTPSLG